MRTIPFILLAGIALAACERRAVPVSMETVRGEDSPLQETWNAHLVLSAAGRPRLDIRSAYQASFERGDSAFVLMTGTEDAGSNRVRAVVYDENGDTTAVVQADRLYWYADEERMEARGNVVVDAENGRRLESEYLEWDDASRTVSTPGFARIHSDEFEGEGYGLVADEGLEEVQLSNVSGLLEVDEE